MYYEAHITIEDNFSKDKHDLLSDWALRHEWKYSAIAGDIVLGDDIKFYLTKHYQAKEMPEEIINDIKKVSAWATEDGFKVIRSKLELILYDTKAQ